MRSRWDPSLLNRRGVAHNPTNVHQDSINRSNFSELDPVSRKNVTILITNRVQQNQFVPKISLLSISGCTTKPEESIHQYVEFI